MSNDTKALVERLRIRASIRRRITTRKSVQEGKPDRIADLLEEAATALERAETGAATNSTPQVSSQPQGSGNQPAPARVEPESAAPVAGDAAIVWSEPRQMWDGSWYRVGSSTGANLSAQQVPGGASHALYPSMVLVPMEASVEMRLAAMREHRRWQEDAPEHQDYWRTIYRAMLSAHEAAAWKDR